MAKDIKKKSPEGDFNYTDALLESYTSSISNIKGVQLYNFVSALRSVGVNDFYFGNTYKRMTDDSVISAAIDMYVEDATQVDATKNKMVWVELDMPDDTVEDELSKGMVKELNRFLSEIEIEKLLPLIAGRVVTYGDCPAKLGFVDKLEEDRLRVNKLKSKVPNRRESAEMEAMGKMLKEAADTFHSKVNTSSYSIEDEKIPTTSLLCESEIATMDKLKESLTDSNRVVNKHKLLKESSFLKEDGLIEYSKLLPGRWYVDLLGDGSSLFSLKSKGKLIAFLDKNDSQKIITNDNIIMFMNYKTEKTTIEVGDPLSSDDEKEYYTVEKGQSFLKNARIAWQVLSAVEDLLLLTRMTRSILYRIFSVEVGQKGNKETMDILLSLKKKMKMDESIDIKDKIYNSNITQVPLGDSIFIPTRNGVGAIKVDTVGGDVNIREAVDLDYFKDKLFAALKVPRSFLGFEDDMPGSLGNTSLVRMDIRYARTVKALQNVLVDGIKQICNAYLRYTREEKVLKELPDFRIVMTSINTAEDQERIESEQIKMETVDKVIESFNNLGIDLSIYTDLRNKIIQQYFGSEYYDLIKKYEAENPAGPIVPTEPDNKEIKFNSTPVNVSDTGDENTDFGGGKPEDNLIGGENNTEEGPEVTEPNNGPENKEIPQEVPFSLK